MFTVKRLKLTEGIKSTLVGMAIGIVISGIGALISAQMAEKTATPEFCASCHEMKPMYETWERGPHGPLGNKRGAIRASCTDCHLPHSNVVKYLTAKGISGTKDFIVHVFYNGYSNNAKYWIEKRNERESYVYVSNCERCHKVLPVNAMHEALKNGGRNSNCLTCHWQVGHGENFKSKLKNYFENN